MKIKNIQILLMMPLFLSGCAMVEQLPEHTEEIQVIAEAAIEVGTVVATINPSVGAGIVVVAGLVAMVSKLFTK